MGESDWSYSSNKVPFSKQLYFDKKKPAYWVYEYNLKQKKSYIKNMK